MEEEQRNLMHIEEDIVNFSKIGPLNPAIHGIRVASVIAFSVCVSVCMFSVCYKFSNSTPA